MKKLLFLIVFLIPFNASASTISYDSTTDVSANSGVGVNITVNSGDTLLIVHGIGSVTGTLTSISATIGGHSMTQLGTIVSGPNKEFFLYYLNPPVGTQSLVITETGDTAHLSRASLYKGTITSGWTPNYIEGAGTNNVNLSVNITIGSNTSWIVGGFRNDGSVVTSSSGTIRGSSANNIFTMDSAGTVSTGSNTVTVSNGNSGQTGYHIVEIPTDGAGGGSPSVGIATSTAILTNDAVNVYMVAFGLSLMLLIFVRIASRFWLF
jgi:hypothetical protein